MSVTLFVSVTTGKTENGNQHCHRQNNADNVLFTENGIALAEKNGAAYDRVFSYQDLLPLSRIGDIGRLMSVWKLTESSDGKILTIK